MKRFHVHVAVSNIEKSAQFYSAMFGMQPTVKKNDYAKWMLDDPRVNFAISERGSKLGVNHLGFQAETDVELEEIHARLKSADAAIVAEEGANCCYAKSDKYWVEDPSGIAWESFRSLGSIPFFGADDQPESAAKSAAKTTLSAAGCAPQSCQPSIAQAACATNGADNVVAKSVIEKTNMKGCCNG